jgi:glycosyltransferase involved in cell wall biosynthesis
MHSKSYVSIIIPTVNEEGNMKRLMVGIKKALKDYKYETIVVDGNLKGPSTDKTVDIARANGARILYDFHGKGSAVIAGFNSAKGNIVIMMDADLSHKAEELKLLIASIEAGYDVCLGSRFLCGGGTADMPPIRVFGNWVFVTLVNVCYGSHYTDLCYGYKSFSRKALKRMNLKEKGYGIETEIAIKARKLGLPTIEVPSFEKKRAAGDAKVGAIDTGLRVFAMVLKHLND